MFWKAWGKYYDVGLLIIRLGFGLGFIYFNGWGKLVAGPEQWEKTGSVMGHIGIDFGHTFFGFMAMFSESFAALFIALGLFFQPMLALLGFTMIMASISHIATGRGSPGHSLRYAAISLGLIFTGPGKYSLDAWLNHRLTSQAAERD